MLSSWSKVCIKPDPPSTHSSLKFAASLVTYKVNTVSQQIAKKTMHVVMVQGELSVKHGQHYSNLQAVSNFPHFITESIFMESSWLLLANGLKMYFLHNSLTVLLLSIIRLIIHFCRALHFEYFDWNYLLWNYKLLRLQWTESVLMLKGSQSVFINGHNSLLLKKPSELSCSTGLKVTVTLFSTVSTTLVT